MVSPVPLARMVSPGFPGAAAHRSDVAAVRVTPGGIRPAAPDGAIDVIDGATVRIPVAPQDVARSAESRNDILQESRAARLGLRQEALDVLMDVVADELFAAGLGHVPEEPLVDVRQRFAFDAVAFRLGE